MPKSKTSHLIAIEKCAVNNESKAWRLGCSLLGNEADAEDAVQQALTILVAKGDEVPRPLPWAYYAAVITNVARNQRRKRARRSSAPMEDAMLDSGDVGDQADVAGQDELGRVARKALESLDENQREALSLTQLGGLTNREAAEIRGVPLATQKSHAQRGLKELRRKLGVEDDHRALAALAVIPFALPDASVPEMMSAAVSSVTVSATSAALSSTVVQGVTGIAMTTKATIASVAAVVGLGIGAAAATLIVGSGEVESQKGSESAKVISAPKTNEVKPSATAEVDSLKKQLEDLSAEKQASEADAKRARTELAAATTQEDNELRRLQAEIDRLKAELEAAQAGEAATLANQLFSHAKDLGWLGEEDFEAFSKEYAQLQKKFRVYNDAKLRGETEPKGARSEYWTSFRKAEQKYANPIMLIMGTLPTYSKEYVGAAMAHPAMVTAISMNLLEDSELPLSERQLEQVTKLAQEFEATWTDNHSTYNERTPHVRKLYDEFEAKQAFYEDFRDLMSAQQREVFYSPDLEDYAVRELYVPTELLSTNSISGENREALRQQVEFYLKAEYEADDEFIARNAAIIDRWLLKVDESIDVYAKESNLGVASIRTFSRAYVEAVEEMLKRDIDDPKLVERILASDSIYTLRTQ